MIAVIAALRFGRAGDRPVILRDERDRLAHQRDDLRLRQAAGEQVKTGLAAHRAEINDRVAPLGARVGREQMLDGVHSGDGEKCSVGLFHAQVEGVHVAVAAAVIQARRKNGVVDGEAFDLFHTQRFLSDGGVFGDVKQNFSKNPAYRTGQVHING